MGNLTTNIGNQVGKNIMEEMTMPAIVEFPTVVKNALQEFGPLFANEPERKHFAEYLTGLMVAHKKNVSAINSESNVSYKMAPGYDPITRMTIAVSLSRSNAPASFSSRA